MQQDQSQEQLLSMSKLWRKEDKAEDKVGNL